MFTTHAKAVLARDTWLVAGLIAVTLPAHAGSVRTAIEAQNMKFSAAAVKADGAEFAALYTADAQVLPAGHDAVKGTHDLSAFWRGVLDSGVRGVTLKTLEVYAQGMHATEVCEYDLKDKAGKSVDYGKYVVVWKPRRRRLEAVPRYLHQQRGAEKLSPSQGCNANSDINNLGRSRIS